MGIKIYNRIGLRRDRNLSDLSNPTESLNNLLNGLTVGGNSSFISEDLNSIRGIASLGLDSSGYRQFISSAETFTSPSGSSSDFFPRITYQNRLDRLKVFAGEPRLYGGNGLTAKYYNKTQVYSDTVGVFSGSPFKTDNFWEQGNFTYSGKITPESIDVNGGVEWEGYFIPTTTGQHTFYVNTTALTTFDFETEGYVSGIGTYTEQSRVGIASTFAGSGSANTNVITLSSAANTNYVGIGQSVTASGIVVGSIVKSYSRSDGVITLTPPSGSTYALSGNVSGNVTFYKTLGQLTQIYYTSYVLEKFRKYRVRFRYYIPQNLDSISAQRSIDFNFARPSGGSDDNLRYNNLYSLDYDFSDASKGDFIGFLDNSLVSGGGTCGGTLSSNSYVKIQTSKKVDIRYQPKTSASDIIKLTISGTTTNNSSVINLSSTSGLELGNYVYGTNITNGTTIKEIVINNSVILSANATGSGTVNLTFVDHRGLVKRAVGSGSAGSFTLSGGNTTTDLKSGMIMIGSGVQAYTGITTTGSATVFNISPPQTIGAGTTVYFYQSRGLVNNALAPFCPPAANKCLFVSVAAGIGSTVIQVNDTTGISVGWTVQGYQFASGTTVTSIVSTGTTSISLSTGIINNLIVGGNFTVTNGTADKTLCCPPTDTSLPFNPTADGLETVSAARSLRIDSGNILFDALKVGIANTITTYSDSDVSTSRLSIQTPSGTFKLLCA
jgi:hypothetical protein